MAVSRTSNMMRCMRALVMWSAASLSATVPTPLNGDPSRRISYLPEVTVVGFVKTGAAQVEVLQPSAGLDHEFCKIGPHIARRLDLPEAAGGGGNRRHAVGLARELAEVDTIGFDVDDERTAPDPRRQFLDRADEADAALVEQRHAAADRLHHVEHVRGQQDGHAAARQVENEVEQF